MAPTVVIVDDSEPFRRAARDLLELDGYRVIGEAGDGAGGIEAVGRLHPDVVLLDIGLPDTSGLDVAERLASGPSRVVLVSSRDPSDIGRRLTRCGAVGFLPKDELSGVSLGRLLAGSP
jgi:DNA-binding NarL/FixJ family response regulator